MKSSGSAYHDPVRIAPTMVDRVEAVRQTAKRLSRCQLLNGVDGFLAEADAARERGDLRGHRIAMACWNITWDEIDRRDLSGHEQTRAAS
jgi:hypothetical protein